MKLFVAAIIKNEMDALLEWIAYHRVVGVSGFIIADNGSNDGSRAFLDGLEKLGIVSVLDFPDVEGQKPQLPAYERILRTCSTDIDLLAFIDADEFLVPLDPEQSIAASLDKWFSDPSVSAVALNWSNFGSNGELFAEEGLVIERFTQRAPQLFNANKNFKSIVRPNSAIHFNNPHHAELRYGRYIDTLGNDLVLHPKNMAAASARKSSGERCGLTTMWLSLWKSSCSVSICVAAPPRPGASNTKPISKPMIATTKPACWRRLWPLKSKPKWQQYRRSWMPYPQKRVHRKATPAGDPR